MKSKWNVHAAPLFRTKGILNIYDLNRLQTGCFVYKAMHNMLPLVFCEYFVLNTGIHSHDTRHSSNIHQDYSRTCVRQNSIKSHGTRAWNTIAYDIKQSFSLASFSRKYKSCLLSKDL